MENNDSLIPQDQTVLDETVSIEENDADDEELSFEDLGLDEITLKAIEKKGFKHPSPIQQLAIPRLLNGDANVIARARTGTGKTAAFGLPLVQSLRGQSDDVKAIILEPTRELAMQTATEMASFTTGVFPRTTVVYGGAAMGQQIRQLRNGTEIVVGTPGRVQDLMERGVLDISKIEYFILDEGDEMLDMGFVDDIEAIFEKANPQCRVLLFSATIPKEILKIAQKFMGDYEIVEEEGVVEEPLLIEQKYWVLRESEKIEALVRLIDISPDFYGLVFVQKKTDADYVSKTLDEKGYEVGALHGDIPQGQREKILSRFRSGKTRILVATDVAARGIDIEGLTHVVNYELPFDGPTYVHRIGRTGRAGSSGIAITFVRPEERRKLGHLQFAIRKSAKGEMVQDTIPTVEQVIEAKKTRLIDDVKNKLFHKEEPGAETASAVSENDDEIIPMDEDLPTAGEAWKMENEAASGSAEYAEVAENVAPVPALKKGDPIFDQLAAELCAGQNPQEVLSSLLSATYGSLLSKKRYGKINTVSDRNGGRDRNGRDRGMGRDRGGRGEGRRGGKDVFVGENQIRLYVQLGWHDGYNPKKIAGFFGDLVHVRDRDVDAIDMSDKFCLVTLPKEAGLKALGLSRNDSTVPHMHQDVRTEGSRRGGVFEGGRESRGGFGGRGEVRGGGFGGRDFGRGDRNRDRGNGRNGRGGRNFHNQTNRNSKAAIYRKGSEEY